MNSRIPLAVLCAAVVGLLATHGCGDRSADPTSDSGITPADGTPPKQDGVTPTSDNYTCAKAARITLQGGSATVSGSTDPSLNEFGTSINCGSGATIMRAPQAYYKVRLTKGQSYRMTLSPQFYSARLYLFTGCTATQINADCGSGGKTGAVSGSILRNRTGSLFFTPPMTQDYIVAVDGTSTSSSGAGAFTLAVETFSAPDNDRCARATAITLQSGKVTVQGTTAGTQNEYGTGINCGQSYSTLNGSQVYYRLAMSAGKTYQITLMPSFYFARFYVFGAQCNEAAINADCGSGGKTGILSPSGSTTSGTKASFSPAQSGTYTIAVDATSDKYSGSFELTVEESSAPQNDRCTKATAVSLSGGKATITGSTLGASDEFGSQVKCGSTSLDGPQAYYAVALPQDKTFKFTVTADFSARFYIFGSSCQPAQIESDCASKGQSGDYAYAFSSGSPATLYFRSAGGTYHLAVDSTSSNNYGKFTVQIEEFSPADNGQCKQAKLLTLAGGTVKVSGDTTGVPNEFGTAVNCGNYSSILYGNQVYYRLALTAGKNYTFTMTPDYYSARLYVFGNTCNTTQINADCASKGQTGDVSGYTSKGKPVSITFKPQTTGLHLVAVDGTSTQYFGSFTLEITEK